MTRSFTLTMAGSLLAFGLAVASAVHVSAQPAPVRFEMEVRADFFAGFSGSAERLARGMARAEAALAADPAHAEAMVWHGSGLMFKAGQAFQAGDSATGLELFGRGLGEMNTAVALAPDEVGVRIPRGATLFDATRFMPPVQAEPLVRLAVGDYERVLELQASVFETLGGHAKGELLFGLADGYVRLGDPAKARLFFQRMADSASPSPRRDYAANWLSGDPQGRVPSCGPCHSGK